MERHPDGLRVGYKADTVSGTLASVPLQPRTRLYVPPESVRWPGDSLAWSQFLFLDPTSARGFKARLGCQFSEQRDEHPFWAWPLRCPAWSSMAQTQWRTPREPQGLADPDSLGGGPRRNIPVKCDRMTSCIATGH